MSETISDIYNVTDRHPGTLYEYFSGVAVRLNLPAASAISLVQAKLQLLAGMLSYMAESRRIDNAELLKDFGLTLQFPDLAHGPVSL